MAGHITAAERRAVSAVLADEANAELTADEVADKAIQALDGVRAKMQRFVSVAQIIGPEGPSRAYVVGPWSTYLRATNGAQMSVRAREQFDRLGLTYRFMVGTVLPDMNIIPELYRVEEPRKAFRPVDPTDLDRIIKPTPPYVRKKPT